MQKKGHLSPTKRNTSGLSRSSRREEHHHDNYYTAQMADAIFSGEVPKKHVDLPFDLN